jgi:3-oxoacyl-[acyl-carrier-protein] synthase-3
MRGLIHIYRWRVFKMRISYFLPEKVLTNEELESFYDSPEWTSAKIYQKTGIKKRHIALDLLTSDMAVNAAELLFAEYGIDRSAVDLLILCTPSPDYFLPSTSCVVQDRLGLSKNIGAFDYNLGCSGYIYGLALAKSLITSEIAQKILLITSETYTKYINELDRSTRTIFGDAASATFIDRGDAEKIGAFKFGTDGEGVPNLIVPAGAFAMKRPDGVSQAAADSNGNVRSAENLYMNGSKIFSFTLQAVPAVMREVLKRNKMTLEDIDFVVPHQANRFMLESLRNSMKIPAEKFCIDLEDIGNTVSSSVPIAMKRAVGSSKLRDGMKVLLAGFGVGYSIGATIIEI